MRYDVVVVGGGPAGMAAALAADAAGADTLIVERDDRLGGILNQCIHSGFGLHYFGEELTGPEYAHRFAERVAGSRIKVLTQSMALSIGTDRKVGLLSPQFGYVTVEAGAIVLAMGCRERTAGAIALPGTRPAGVYTAGMAQKMCNVEGYLVGKRVVILGSGDIGLIMARRMTLEGAKVECVIELMPFSSGLKRNIVQCLEDFAIPIHYSHTVTRIVGKPRMEGLYYAPVGPDRKPDLSREKFVACDSLLLSVGLIPENDLLDGSGIEMSPVTAGAIVDENRMTSAEGVFSCGNVLHVHDLVDNVSREAEIAGSAAARFAKGALLRGGVTRTVSAGGGVRYALPQRISPGEGVVDLYFRVDNIYRNCRLVVEASGKTVLSKKYLVLAPGEMESVALDRSAITGDLSLRLEKC